MAQFRIEKQVAITTWRTEIFYAEAESFEDAKNNLEALHDNAEDNFDISYETLDDCNEDMTIEQNEGRPVVCWIIDDEEVFV
jgi:hypothetical protein